jgi:hypothetical protein
MVIRSVAAIRSIAVGVSDFSPSGPRKFRIATSARADSDTPERKANALKRIFSTTEGRAVMQWRDDLVVGSAVDDTG